MEFLLALLQAGRSPAPEGQQEIGLVGRAEVISRGVLASLSLDCLSETCLTWLLFLPLPENRVRKPLGKLKQVLDSILAEERTL